MTALVWATVGTVALVLAAIVGGGAFYTITYLISEIADAEGE